MNSPDLIPVVILAMFSATAALGASMTWLILRWRRRHHSTIAPGAAPQPPWSFDPPLVHRALLHRPTSWLTIRSRNLRTVQSALGLSNPEPCTWTEALAGGRKLFLAPPVNGWILLVGSALPDPADDVDACFRFLLDLSRRLGHVQFFNADPVTGQHAWVRAESGRVVRAYVWAGATIWNQGAKTRAEVELGLDCFPYFEAPASSPFTRADVIATNTELVPLLAARWSLDPDSIDEIVEHARGIAGEPARFI